MGSVKDVFGPPGLGALKYHSARSSGDTPGGGGADFVVNSADVLIFVASVSNFAYAPYPMGNGSMALAPATVMGGYCGFSVRPGTGRLMSVAIVFCLAYTPYPTGNGSVPAAFNAVAARAFSRLTNASAVAKSRALTRKLAFIIIVVYSTMSFDFGCQF